MSEARLPAASAVCGIQTRSIGVRARARRSPTRRRPACGCRSHRGQGPTVQVEHPPDVLLGWSQGGGDHGGNGQGKDGFGPGDTRGNRDGDQCQQTAKQRWQDAHPERTGKRSEPFLFWQRHDGQLGRAQHQLVREAPSPAGRRRRRRHRRQGWPGRAWWWPPSRWRTPAATTARRRPRQPRRGP